MDAPMLPRCAATVLMAAVIAVNAVWASEAVLRSLVFRLSEVADRVLIVVVNVAWPVLVPSLV